MRGAKKAKKADYHHGDLKRALVQAGLEALESGGWHELSLRDVARHAGVSHTAPYRHFASKEALLASLAEVGYGELADAMEAAVSARPGDPREQLRGSGRAYVGLALRRPALFRLMFSGAICGFTDYDSFAVVAKRSFDVLVRLLTQAQALGAMKPGPPEQAALTVWALVHGLSLLLLEQQLTVLGPGPVDSDAIVDGAILHLTQGLFGP